MNLAFAAAALAVFGLGCERGRADRVTYVDGGRVTSDNTSVTETFTEGATEGEGKMTAHEITIEGDRNLADDGGTTTLTAGEQPGPARDAGK